MEKKKVAIPLVCHGHSRPVVDLFYSPVTPDGYFLISASKGKRTSHITSPPESRAMQFHFSFVIGLDRVVDFDTMACC
jgi:hypothetical protein